MSACIHALLCSWTRLDKPALQQQHVHDAGATLQAAVGRAAPTHRARACACAQPAPPHPRRGATHGKQGDLETPHLWTAAAGGLSLLHMGRGTGFHRCLAFCALQATSALDATSEAQVQSALDRAMKETTRSCLVIAHRCGVAAPLKRHARCPSSQQQQCCPDRTMQISVANSKSAYPGGSATRQPVTTAHEPAEAPPPTVRCCRLVTVRNAHDILVMDKGQIVEQGSHDSLVAQGGIYAKMVARQTGGGLASNIDVRPAACWRR